MINNRVNNRKALDRLFEIWSQRCPFIIQGSGGRGRPTRERDGRAICNRLCPAAKITFRSNDRLDSTLYAAWTPSVTPTCRSIYLNATWFNLRSDSKYYAAQRRNNQKVAAAGGERYGMHTSLPVSLLIHPTAWVCCRTVLDQSIMLMHADEEDERYMPSQVSCIDAILFIIKIVHT